MNRPSIAWPRVLGAVALLVPGVIAFQPTFGGIGGYVAPLAGVLLGAGVAIGGQLLRLRFGYRVLALLACYLLVGGPVVVPDATAFGFLPTLDSLRRLSLLTFQGWEDLLTVATPAGDFSGPAAAPFLSGLIFGAAMAGVVVATSAVALPLLLPVGFLALAIAFGTRTAPHAPWLGAVLGAGALIWLVGHRLAKSRQASASILVRRNHGASQLMRSALAASLVIALASGLAVTANHLTGTLANRQVLRDNIVPPLNLQEYASPLMKYRLYEGTQKEEVLFEVRGMPAGTRLRLAVLESYDGNVFNVSQDAQQYLRAGRELPIAPSGESTTAEIRVVGYNGVWVPTFGDSRRVEFSGENAGQEAKGLHFNAAANQALTTARLRAGSTYRLAAVPLITLDDAALNAINKAGIGRAQKAEVARVPDVLARAATDWTAEAGSAYQQVAAIAAKLREEGFYSDGSDGFSRSGHTSERLNTLLESPQWIGDDEQYATAMALMVNQLGIPARVVMGFHPLEGEPPADLWEVTGTEAHVWVEANLDGAGWVAFDPTPDRDQVPKTEVPLPKPKPKPQVDPPPNPPERLPDEIIVPDEDAANVDEEDEPETDLSWLWTALIWAGVGLGTATLAATPFLVILALKRRRARHRATSGDLSDQLVGAWDEVIDTARDIGHPVVTTETRRESAVRLSERFPQVDVTPLARRLDSSLFAPVELHGHLHEAAWNHSKELRKGLLATVPWHRRAAVTFSTRSLAKRRPEAALKGPRNSKQPPTLKAPTKPRRSA